MKRFGYSDSLEALISISPSSKDSPKSKQVYSRDFQAMIDSLEEEDYKEEETSQGGSGIEKKRRLTLDQVKALEKNFEVENRLEPERKAKLAEELGLQPRQVSVWFQNRRARSKTKDLEREYNLLKANYDALKRDYTHLEHKNKALTTEIIELKAKLGQENYEQTSGGGVVKDEESPVSDQSKNQELCDNNVNASSSSIHFTGSSSSSSQSSMTWVQLSDSRTTIGNVYHQQQQPQFVKLEEQNLFNLEDSCNFFSIDQAPTLQWYFSTTGQ